MLDDNLPSWGGAAADPLSLAPRFAGLEPVRRRREDGAIHDSKSLGRLRFSWMPSGRPSYWHGTLAGAEGTFPMRLVLEVEGDDLPGADHAACVVAIRRRHGKDAAACLPLVHARLKAMRSPLVPSGGDLRLTGIHLPARPMVSSRQMLEYRLEAAPELVFMAVFLHGKPTAVHVDRDF